MGGSRLTFSCDKKPLSCCTVTLEGCLCFNAAYTCT